MSRSPRPRLATLRNKLALLFFGITSVAFGVMYFVVVPQLQSNLEEQELDDLRRSAGASRASLEGLMGRGDVTARELDRRVRAVADGAGARVTLLGVQQAATGEAATQRRVRFFVITDSREERDVPANERLAAAAVRSRSVREGRSRLQGDELGQLAQPLTFRGRIDWVALYSRSLADVSDTVSFIRRRLLAATGVALLLALIGGYLVAQALARRVRRLERGAQEVAAGRFLDPLPVDSEDELGQLTRTFNEMQRQLRRVDVARKEFVATASHELRTPIFSLSGFLELLQDEELDEATRQEFLDTMAEQIERLQKLSVDLLDLSRLDAGSLELNEEAVDLSELAETVTGEFKPAIARHRTDLELTAPESGVTALADRERVVQIMRILLDNALRHTPEGTQVTVSTHSDNGTAGFTVADTGPGLVDESQVFERFYTGDATRGAGLGLAIAQELAERMEGRIRTESGAGSTSFTLELPAAGDGL